MVHNFTDRILPAGASSYMVKMEVPVEMPQTRYTRTKEACHRKLRYFFKAQLVPIEISMVNNGHGKSKLRDRQRVHISPACPIVTEPKFNVVTQIEKKVGLRGKGHCEAIV